MFCHCFDSTSPKFANGIGAAVQLLSNLCEGQVLAGVQEQHLPIMCRQLLDSSFELFVLLLSKLERGANASSGGAVVNVFRQGR